MNSKKNVLVSIFLPTYARAAHGYLQRSIESVLEQTYPFLELLILDDGSIDGSEEIIKKYCESDSRVIHIRSARTGLPALNIAKAYPISRGDFIAFAFDDCALRPRHIESLLNSYLNYPKVGMVYGKCLAHWDADTTVTIGKQFSKSDMQAGNNHVANVAVMVSRQVLDQVGLYDTHILLKRFCDWDLWLRISRKYEIRFLDEYVADEYGTSLIDSLGSSVSVFTQLMLSYSATDRDDKLLPGVILEKDPFDLNPVPDMSDTDVDNVRYLVAEHLISLGDVASASSLLGNSSLLESYSRSELDSLTFFYMKKTNLLKEEVRRLNGVANIGARTINSLENELSNLRKLLSVSDNKLRYLEMEVSRYGFLKKTPFKQMFASCLKLFKFARFVKHKAVFIKSVGLRHSLRYFNLLKKIWKYSLIRRFFLRVSVNCGGVFAPKIGNFINALVICDGPIPSTDIAVVKPLEWLVGNSSFKYKLFYQNSAPILQAARGYSILIVMRACTPETLKFCRDTVQEGIPLLFMLDDDFSELDPRTPLGKAYIENNSWGNVLEICKLSDMVFVWSESLRIKLSDFARRVERVNAIAPSALFNGLPDPNFADRDQVEEIRIGYAGSVTHSNDLSIISDAMSKILHKYPNVCFETIGAKCVELDESNGYRHFESISDIDSFYKFLLSRRWDIGLAPLVDNAFNRAKSNNKYREYAAAKIPGIYSDIPVYSEVVRSGVNGILCSSESCDWVSQISKLIQDVALRNKIADCAYGDVLENNSLDVVSGQYSRLISQLNSRPRVLAIGPTHIPSFVIDIDLPFSVLRECGDGYLRKRDVGVVDYSDVHWADYIIIVRCVSSEVVSILDYALALGRPVVYSWDDDFFRIPEDSGDLYNYYHSPKILKNLKHILKRATLVKATTKRLANVSRQFSGRVVEFPYAFDLKLIENSAQSSPSHTFGSQILVGYFGNPRSDGVFHIVVSAINEVSLQRPGIRFVFFGCKPEGLAPHVDVSVIEYRNDYVSAISEFLSIGLDIGIAPLADTEFNNSKLPTKYRDYAAASAAGIYSNVECYSSVVSSGVNGLLCDNTVEAWSRALLFLIDNPEVRIRMADAAHSDLVENYSIEGAAGNWKVILDSLSRMKYDS